MRNFARIENNRVVELFDLDEHHPEREGIDGLFAPTLDWRPCPKACAEGWVVHRNTLRASDDYRVRRAREYPDVSELADGFVKQSDPATKDEGNAQIANYYAACLAVKAAYPKPQ